MTWACLFEIWLRIFDERTGVFSEKDERRGHMLAHGRMEKIEQRSLR